jgi:iron(III) transport system substrate-binding protein
MSGLNRALSAWLALCGGLCGAASAADHIVVYTALDRSFSEPILQRFQERTGIEVRAVYDAESTKTVGLVNRIRAEHGRPRCDVFWNNEIVNTLRLKAEGLLQPCSAPPAHAQEFPAQFQDPQGLWYGFAARARVLIVNNDLVPPGQEPRSLFDLVSTSWKGRVGMAKPLFGTTASHVACLYAALGRERTEAWLAALKANGVQILPGNKTCAEAVGAGRLACALTDTDDAVIELAAGRPVRIVYLDSGPDDLGTLFIPNTLGVVAGCPNPQGAALLIDFLLSAEVEQLLADGPSAQIPLNRTFHGQLRVKTPQEVKPMAVDFADAAAQFDTAARFIEENFSY